MNRSKLTTKEALNARRWKIKPHDVGLQVSPHLHSKVPQEAGVWAAAKTSWRGFQRAIYAKGGQSGGRYLMAGHVHILLSIPPKYSVTQSVGFIKGKSAIHIARNFSGHKRNFIGQNFGARGHFVSTVGKDEKSVREYIRHQETEDRRFDQPRPFRWLPPSGGVRFQPL